MHSLVFFVVGAVAGFISGALFYRNNSKKLETELAVTKTTLEDAKKAI